MPRKPQTQLRRLTDALLYAVVVVFARLYQLLGAAVGYRVATAAGWGWYTLFRGRRRVIHRNLEIAFGEALTARERDRIGLSCCRHALATITDLAVREQILARVDWRDVFTVDEVLEAALTSEHPRGLAILSAHLGSWEVGQYFCGLRGRPASPVVRELDNPLLDRAAVRLRTRFGERVIPKSGALRGILGELRRGGTVAIIADQSAPRTEYYTPFFGRGTFVHASFASVLVRARCDVIFSVCIREGLRFRFAFRSRRLEVAEDGDERSRAHALVDAYNAALEEAIRGHPEQYLWMHRKWKSQPEGEASPY